MPIPVVRYRIPDLLVALREADPFQRPGVTADDLDAPAGRLTEILPITPPYQIGDTVYALQPRRRMVPCAVCLNGARWGHMDATAAGAPGVWEVFFTSPEPWQQVPARSHTAMLVLGKKYPCAACRGRGEVADGTEYHIQPGRVIFLGYSILADETPSWKLAYNPITAEDVLPSLQPQMNSYQTDASEVFPTRAAAEERARVLTRLDPAARRKSATLTPED